MKKFAVLLLALAVFMLFCGMAGAEPITGTCGENLTWTLENNVLTISGTGEMTITANANAPWDRHRDSTTTVVIDSGVTSIGNNAFFNHNSLTSVSIPGSVTKIGGGAFMNCSSLAGIALPDNLTDIGRLAFAHCSSLESVTIPNGVTGIGHNAFQECTSLKSITIPDSVTSIGDSAFQNCSSLERVSIPDSVTSIGDGAFSDCGSSLRIRCEKRSEAWTYATANSIPVECVTHGDLSYYPKVESTCTAAGNIEYWECADCGMKFSDEAATAVIDGSVTTEALGHDWSKITYTWADDHSKVTAAVECSRGCGVEPQTKEVADTSAVTKDPTCTEKGRTIYTAEFVNGIFSKQEKVIENVDALGHDRVHHAGQAATCTKAGWKDYDTCKRCDYTTYAKIPALGHKWGAPAYAWAKDKSAVTAKRVCAHDASHVQTETVKTTYKVTKKPTYTAAGVGTYTTKPFTNTAFKKQTKKVSIAALPRTSISKATVKAIGDQVYTGSAIKPALTVKYKGTKLVKGTDYAVSFADNVKPGKATVTITGKNAFKGKATVTFTILPKKVKLVSVKPGKTLLTVTWKKGAAITGYEIEYSLKKDFSKPKTVKVTAAATVKTKIQKLKPGKTYYVRIRAYRKVGSKMYYSDWSDSMKAKVPVE